MNCSSCAKGSSNTGRVWTRAEELGEGGEGLLGLAMPDQGRVRGRNIKEIDLPMLGVPHPRGVRGADRAYRRCRTVGAFNPVASEDRDVYSSFRTKHIASDPRTPRLHYFKCNLILFICGISTSKK